MEGFATTRTTSLDGRWVYTLFMRPGGYPFVHALDTVRGVAHCIGLPWTARDQAPLMKMRMTLIDGESKLTLYWNDGRRWLAIDTGSWRITHPSTGGLPWRIPAIAVAVLVALAVALVRRRRTTHAHEEALPQPL